MSKASDIHSEPNTLKQNEAYDTADRIYDDISDTYKVTTEDSAQNVLSQQSPTCGGGEGIEIVYEGVSSSSAVGDMKVSDGDNNCCITETQGSDGENDYYVNDP